MIIKRVACLSATFCFFVVQSIYADGLSIKTNSKSECDRMCSDLIFDCNSGIWTSTGWCIISTDQAPEEVSGLAIKTPTAQECRELSGYWRQDKWCVIGDIKSSLQGVWSWSADCPSGKYQDKFEINKVSRGNLSGVLHHNSLHNTITGRIIGGRITFYRSYTYQGKTNKQIWTGKYDGAIINGTLTDSSHASCTWSARKM